MGTTTMSGILWLLGSLVVILMSNFVTNVFSKHGSVQEPLCKERRENCNTLLTERHNELVKKIDCLTASVDALLHKKE